MTVFTIGYEGLQIAEFTALLAEHGVETVVDVRDLPLSRKPGFSKKSLASVLSLAGIGYIHLADLGCPRPVRDRYREDGNWQRYTKGFLQHLAGQQSAIADLAKLANKSTCALEHCYEEFLVHNCNTEEREYAEAADQIREVLIHGNYLSQKDIEICLSFDVESIADHTGIDGIRELHQALAEKYQAEET